MEWRPFDTHSFLKASRDWPEQKAKLQEKLNRISTLPSINNETGVRSGNVSDITADIAFRRLKIKAEIDAIEQDEEMLDYALKTISEDERALINGIYYPKKKVGVFVQEYAHSHYMCERRVYNEKDRVLKKMGDAILNRYY